jgi:NAD(P)-dependent dehydrogenase (short-subunit alcohol dehydrogenase family)
MSQSSTIIITGASRGIGFELVRFFLKKTDLNVIATSRTVINIPQDFHQFQHRLQYYSLDFLNNDSISSFIYMLKNHGQLKYLINNAGLLINKPVAQLTPDEMNNMFSVNVMGPFRIIQELIKEFHSGSHIVNISSMGGFQGSAKYSGLSGYSASKGALNILTECLAEELKEKQISVNALALGAVQTEMLEEAFPGYKAEITPEEMAEYIGNFTIVAYKYINGKIIPVSLQNP